MIINYLYKYTDFNLFFLKYLLKIMHNFQQFMVVTIHCCGVINYISTPA